MEYWDNKGNIHNENEQKNLSLALLNGTKAKINNLADFLAETNPNSNTYKTKRNTLLGLELATLAGVPNKMSVLPSSLYYLNTFGNNFVMPRLKDKHLELLGKKDKNVVLKDNIVEKNKGHHPEVGIKDNNTILDSSLYNPDYIMRTQIESKPDYYMFVNKNPDSNRLSLLDMNDNKDQYELVNWFSVNEKRLKNYIKKATDEGGEFLITDRNKPEGAARLSALDNGYTNIITDMAKNFKQKFIDYLMK